MSVMEKAIIRKAQEQLSEKDNEIASLQQQLAEAKKDNEFLKEAIDLAVKDRDHYLEESQSRLEGLTGCMESKRVLIDRITSLEGAATRKDGGCEMNHIEWLRELGQIYEEAHDVIQYINLRHLEIERLQRENEELRKDAERLGKLLREASGPMSYGHWSSDFRNKVKEALK